MDSILGSPPSVIDPACRRIRGRDSLPTRGGAGILDVSGARRWQMTDESFAGEEQLRTSPTTLDRTSTERFTDEEAEFLRHVRFGELPGRVPPTERVETVETGSPTDVPQQFFDPRDWGECGRLL